MAARLLGLYSNLVKKRPALTQIGTAGIITTTGDIIAQKLERNPRGYNVKRTAVMSVFGFCYFGPLVTVWLKFLNQLNMRVAYTVLCDQTCFASPVSAGFVFFHPILSGKSIDEAKSIFKANYLSIYSRGVMLWVPAQLINFSFVPFEFRVLYVQSVALVWNTFLSYRTNRSLRMRNDAVTDNVEL